MTTLDLNLNTDLVPFNRDKLMLLTRDTTAVDVHIILDPINQLPPERQLAASAMLFYVLCKRFNQDAADMHSLAFKMLRPERFHKKGNAQVEALIAYADLHNTGQF
jgi:hypothetical protein